MNKSSTPLELVERLRRWAAMWPPGIHSEARETLKEAIDEIVSLRLTRSEKTATTDGPKPNAATSEVTLAGAQPLADENAKVAGRGAERQEGSIPSPSASLTPSATDPTVEQREAISRLLMHMAGLMDSGTEVNWIAMPHEIWRALSEGKAYDPDLHTR